MAGGVKRKILSEIILWSSMRVPSFESRTTQASVTDAVVKPGKDPGACTQKGGAKEGEGASLHLPWLDCLGLCVWLLQHGAAWSRFVPS